MKFGHYVAKHPIYIYIQGDQKVSVHMTITVQSSGAQKPFDHPVYVCVCVRVYVRVRIVYLYIYVYTYTYTHIHIHTYTCLHASVLVSF